MTLIPIPYIIFFMLTFLLGAFFRSKQKKDIYIFKILTVVLLCIFFIGFRGFIWTDWINYYPKFLDFPTLLDFERLNSYFANQNMNFEKGFIGLSVIIKSLWNNYFFYQLIIFFIDIYFLFHFLSENLPKTLIIFGLCVFFLFSGYVITINLLRQGIAILLSAISIKFIYERRKIPFFLLNILGFYFHVSTILFFPLYFIIYKKYSRRIILFLFIIGNIIFLFQIKWLTSILQILTNFFSYNRIIDLVYRYLNYSKYGISIGYIERTLSFFLIYYFEPKLLKHNKRLLLFINLFYIYIFIFLFLSENAVFLERVACYFVCSYWILYPFIFSLFSRRTKKLFLLLFLIYGVTKNYTMNNRSQCMYENCLFYYNSYEDRIQKKLNIDVK